MTFSDKIKRAREVAGFTQQQLAIAPADLSLSASELREHLCTIQNLYQAMRSLENSGQIATPIEES